MNGPALIRKARETAEAHGCTVLAANAVADGVSVEVAVADVRFLAHDLGCATATYPDAEGFTYVLGGVPVRFWGRRAA